MMRNSLLDFPLTVCEHSLKPIGHSVLYGYSVATRFKFNSFIYSGTVSVRSEALQA